MLNSRAFTLIELIIVIVLIAIVSAAIGPKIFENGYKPQGDAVKFITYVRYIQHESMLHGGGYGLEINPAQKSYYFFYGTNSNPVTLPSEASSTIYVSKSINSVNSEGVNVDKIYFDYLGRTDIDNNSLNNNEMNFSDNNPYKEDIIVTIDGIKIDITPYSGGVYEE